MESVNPVEIGGNARKFLTGPRLEELNKEFERNGGEWKEFKIGDLFEVESSKKIFHANTLSEIFETQVENSYPYVVRSTQDNGIRGYIIEDARFLNEGNSLSFAQDTFSVFYQQKNFFTGNKVKVLKPKFILNRQNANFFVCSFNKVLSDFSWGVCSDVNFIKNLKLTLPATPDGTPDFSYMERYICELEQAFVSELAAYLRAAGLENYDLTAAEQTALDDFKNGKIRFKKFKIGDLFDIHPTKAYKLTNADLLNINGKTPVVSNTSLNNGIIGFSALPPTEQGNIITYSDTTTSDGIFYQPADFIGYPHIQGLYPHQKNKWFEKSLLYFVSLFRKSAAGRFDYTNKFNRKTAAELAVTLPATSDGTPDFFYMESFITAQQKLAIKDVVLWKNKVISTTKKVINES